MIEKLGAVALGEYSAFGEALRLITTLDPELIEIAGLSLRVTLSAVAIGAAIGIPLGALLAISRFPGRTALITVVNALMGLPPVLAGLTVYLMLSTSGPLGVFQLLYTPTAMIIAQTVLVTPIVAAITRQTVADLNSEYDEQLRALGAGAVDRLATLIWDGRFSLITAVLAGFGRAIAEVAAVMIVGGNIDHVTRTMTTAIALETSKGNLPLAIGLGMLLMLIAFAVNAAVASVRRVAGKGAFV